MIMSIITFEYSFLQEQMLALYVSTKQGLFYNFTYLLKLYVSLCFIFHFRLVTVSGMIICVCKSGAMNINSCGCAVTVAALSLGTRNVGVSDS